MGDGKVTPAGGGPGKATKVTGRRHLGDDRPLDCSPQATHSPGSRGWSPYTLECQSVTSTAQPPRHGKTVGSRPVTSGQREMRTAVPGSGDTALGPGGLSADTLTGTNRNPSRFQVAPKMSSFQIRLTRYAKEKKKSIIHTRGWGGAIGRK